MFRPALPILFILLTGTTGLAQTKTFLSPHTRTRALIVSIGPESRVDIRSSSGALWRRKDFTSPDRSHGEAVAHAQWTADGRFFVFTTGSSGGHQPWHVATYFYSVGRNRFYSLDAIVGATVSDFALRGDVLTTTRLGTTPEGQLVTVYLHRRGGGYSYRSVTNGSTRVARRAGR